MTPEQFCYWLQGLLEGNPDIKTVSEIQVKIIREHLDTVFVKVTPSYPDLSKLLIDVPTVALDTYPTIAPTILKC